MGIGIGIAVDEVVEADGELDVQAFADGGELIAQLAEFLLEVIDEDLQVLALFAELAQLLVDLVDAAARLEVLLFGFGQACFLLAALLIGFLQVEFHLLEGAGDPAGFGLGMFQALPALLYAGARLFDLPFAERHLALDGSHLILLADELDIFLVEIGRSFAELLGHLPVGTVGIGDARAGGRELLLFLGQVSVDLVVVQAQLADAFLLGLTPRLVFPQEIFEVFEAGGQRNLLLRQLVEGEVARLDGLGPRFGLERFELRFEVEIGGRQLILLLFRLADGRFQHFQILLSTDLLALEQADRAPGNAVLPLDEAPALRQQDEVVFLQGAGHFLAIGDQHVLE